MQYLVLKTKNLEDLQSDVNRAIDDGFTPMGGIAVAQTQHHMVEIYCQALVKKPTAGRPKKN